MKGPGKYDELCTLVQEATEAEGVILIVLGGNRGAGFSVQATVPIHLRLPSYLRELATLLEANRARANAPVRTSGKEPD